MRPLAAAVLISLAAAGCGGPAFHAATLPPQFRVASRPAGARMNLATIATAGADESRVDAGDLVEITIASGRDDEMVTPVQARVSDSGAADVPLVGPVQLGGLEPFEASQAVAAAAVERGIYRQPHVTLEIKSKAVNRVTVMGAVTTPGVHELPRSSSDLVKALAMAGGLTADAGTEVEIIRQPAPRPGNVLQASFGYDPVAMQGPQTTRVDLASLAAAPADYRLSDRDIVMVRPREKQMVYVTGLVMKPGQYEMPVDQEVRLLDAVTMGGGVASPVADKVLVIRRVPGREEPLPIAASIAGAKRNGSENLVIGPGDVVSVEQTAGTAVVDTMIKLLRFTVGISGNSTVF